MCPQWWIDFVDSWKKICLHSINMIVFMMITCQNNSLRRGWLFDFSCDNKIGQYRHVNSLITKLLFAWEFCFVLFLAGEGLSMEKRAEDWYKDGVLSCGGFVPWGEDGYCWKGGGWKGQGSSHTPGHPAPPLSSPLNHRFYKKGRTSWAYPT